MRYIRQQRFLTTISDEDINDHCVIKFLLQSLCNSNIDLHLVYSDKLHDTLLSYNARIKKVYDSSIDIKAFCGAGSILIRNISISTLVSIKLVTDTDNIMIGNNHMSKFDLLDIEVDEDK